MIIIPTEKRFDWQHAPLVLFAIVILNIFIYFIGQSGDNPQITNAFVEYKKQQYFEIEWPFLQTYLSETNQSSTLEKLENAYTNGNTDSIIGHILFDDKFYRYLRQDQYNYFRSNDVGDWFYIREQINSVIQSTTLVSFGLVPAESKLFSFISHQFMHGSVMHLLGNLFFLIICGFAVEAAIGHWRFLAFYILSGIAGGLLHALFNSQSAAPLVGASGAISGTMAMYLGVFRFKKIEFFYWFFVFVGYFRAPAMFILVFYIGKEIYQLLSVSNSNVAFLAHIGGFVAGATLIGVAYWLNKGIFNEDYIEEDQSIDPLQEKKATIYEFIGKYQFDAAEKAIARLLGTADSPTLEQSAAKQDSNKLEPTDLNHQKNEPKKSETLDFELALLRYNVEKIEKKPDFKLHLIQLLTINQPTEKQADRLSTIWQENTQFLKGIDLTLLIKIAINLTESNSPKHSSLIFEKIFAATQKANNTQYQDLLAVLANKLSEAYARINNSPQQQKYADIKQDLLTGGLS